MSCYRKDFKQLLGEIGETGYVEVVSHPVVYISGLPGVTPYEVVIFENGEMGWVSSLAENLVEVIVLSDSPIKNGTQVARTGELLKVPVGNELLGHSVTPLGEPIYKGLAPQCSVFRDVDVAAPGIDAREKVREPFETGVSVVDLAIPLGKGQRELVVGDRKTGKTEFLMQTMLMSAYKGTVCIYAGIGKRKNDLKKVEKFVKDAGIASQCIIISSSSSDPLGYIYLTPYTGMTMAEFFRDQGKDVLLILDDLTTHAKFYREISLLGKRFPGRGSYPGDIFYTHSRLLERAGNFKTPKGTVSITCLPVAETVEGDISGYIPTNIMSITDGHIFFDNAIFDVGRKPAVNYFLSVTRVGRQTQSRLRWSINRELFSFLTLLEKTQDFIHFGAEINEGIKNTISMGEKILAFFNQPMGKIIDLNVQIIMFTLIWLGIIDLVDLAAAQNTMELTAKKYREDPEFKKKIDDLVSSASDLNDLLGKVAPASTSILAQIGVSK